MMVCAHCGGGPKWKTVKGEQVEQLLQRCSTCKLVWYCSKE